MKSRPPSSRTTFGQGLLLIGFGLLLALLVLALTEWSLRFLGIGEEYLYEDPFVGFVPGRDVFERVERSTGDAVYETVPEKLAFFNQQEFPVDKGRDTYRIFSVGGSTTAGRPYDDRVSFSNWLRIYLPALDPDTRWEVVNAGAISYASYRVVVLMKELMRYAPDLIVVYTGHNEFLEERSYSEIVHQSSALKRLRIWLNGLRSYSLARHWWLSRTSEPRTGDGGLEAEVTAKLDDWTGLDRYERDDELRRSVIEHFEFNLRQMVAIARAHDVEILFIEPISNLKDFSPFKSQPGDSVTVAASARREDLVQRARAALEAGQLSVAGEDLEEAIRFDREFAETHFWLGKVRLAESEVAAARQAFVEAKDLDVAPLRAIEPLIADLERVAKDLDVPLIDLPAKLGTEIPGNEDLLDHVHPTIEVHSLIAREVIAWLIGAGIARPRAAWSPALQRELFARHLATLDRTYYAERDLNLAKVLGWAGKTDEAEPPLRRAVEVLPDNPEVHLNLGIVLQKQGHGSEAKAELERALELQPDLEQAYFNLGVVEGTLGDLEAAVVALHRAVELRPDYAEAWFNLGVLQRRKGDLVASLAALEKAQRYQPNAPETYLQLGLTYRKMRRWSEAEAAFVESLRLEPDNPRALAGLGAITAAQGDPRAALARLEKAVEMDPSDPEAQFELGVAYRGLDRNSEAKEAYRRAIALAPDYAEAHNNLGILLAEEGDLEAASRAFLQAIQTDPGYAEGYFNLGVLYDGVGRGDDALRAVRRAVELAPDTTRFRLALGLLLYAAGRQSEALPHLEQARREGAEVPSEVERWMESQ